MALFKLGDWVEITPKSDNKSDVWDVNIHTHFCGKIGQIIDISEDEEGIIYNVEAYFDKYKPFGQPGKYSAWFEDKHIIKSSQYNFKIKYQLNKEFEEYQRVERKMKNLRDKYLKEIFSDPYIQENKNESSTTQKKYKGPEGLNSFEFYEGYYSVDD